MAFVVVYDAAVLYPAPLRDLLLRVARTGLVRAHWTEQILDECFRNILANRPDLSVASLARTRELMNQAIPDVIVTGYQSLIDGLTLPDPDDRHVLAAAIRAEAQVIVTCHILVAGRRQGAGRWACRCGGSRRHRPGTGCGSAERRRAPN